MMVDRGAGGAGHVAVLGEGEIAEMCAERGNGDVFEVRVCAVRTLEGGGEGAARCGDD